MDQWLLADTRFAAQFSAEKMLNGVAVWNKEMIARVTVLLRFLKKSPTASKLKGGSLLAYSISMGKWELTRELLKAEDPSVVGVNNASTGVMLEPDSFPTLLREQTELLEEVHLAICFLFSSSCFSVR